MGKTLGMQRLVALFFFGALLFNFPLLALWDRELVIAGVPLFPAALFIGWAVLIGLLGWVAEHLDDADPSGGPHRGGGEPH